MGTLENEKQRALACKTRLKIVIEWEFYIILHDVHIEKEIVKRTQIIKLASIHINLHI